MNIQGQVVGTSFYSNVNGDYATGTYAAFSAIGVQSHDYNVNSYIVDNLNNYIATIPGVSLTSAMSIDDLGRIIAFGSNDQAYLLTPNSLGSPEPVPEPTTLALLAVASAGFAARRLRRLG